MGLFTRVLEKERDLERLTARRRQQVQRVVQDVGQQIGERREGDVCFGLYAAIGEDDDTLPPCPSERHLPEHRLADSRLTGEDEPRRPPLDALQQRVNRAELRVASDHSRRHWQTHSAHHPTRWELRIRRPAWSERWARLVSNQRPLACEASVTATRFVHKSRSWSGIA